MSIIIAGDRSGVGKTTVTLALLAALRQRRQAVQSFKVGPDYIDPMFHTYITGRACRNLDPILTSEDYVQQCFTRHSQGISYTLIEGVMGLFDGALGTSDVGSTAHVARLLNIPIVLVLNCSSISRSIAAIVHGFCTFDPRIRVAGVILNQVGSDRHVELLSQALEPLSLPILGVLRRQDNITIPDRHLGLVPTAELSQLNAIVEQLAHLGQTCFDWPKLLPLLSCKEQDVEPEAASPPVKVRLAIAQDEAFSFYYEDNLKILQQLGAELVPWSPLHDRTLPKGIQGLYFGGGFPEIFAAALAENRPAQQAVKSSILAGIPTYAECGGLMYLCEKIVDFAERDYPMTGIVPTAAVMEKRLTLGYRKATALQNSPLVKEGDRFWGHEFHRSSLMLAPTQPLLALQGYDAQSQFPPEGWLHYRVHASYIHVHFGAQSHLAKRFLKHCQDWNRP
ncbi:MAG: cobyrinate a,c-diamide synthase [Acaryochloridaceae cyanobacterium RU_4_10]|nr:cobyrinate a,c-diamide synthase [Acaryochloridaceae cyanobacterium RU_4_10]